MKLRSIIKISFRSIKANKVRTGLTVLGMVIGIATVVIVFSAGEGIRSLILGQVESFGTDIIETESKVPSTKKGAEGDIQSAMAMAQGVQLANLTFKDMADINKLPNINKSYAGILSQQQASYGNEFRKAILYGLTADFIEIDKTKVASGRFFSDLEDKSLAQVAVLGSKIKTKLFGDSEPLGKGIKIGKEKFLIVGVMEEKGAVTGVDFDDFIYLPLRTLQKKLMGLDKSYMIISQLKDVKLAEITADDVKILLRENHNITDPDKDDFRVTTMIEAMKTISTVTDAITLLLLAIVAISLIVGGVGVMNIMYVIITERTAEIGLRKAVGAKYNDIMLQFLIESLIITLIGAAAGVLIGLAASYLIYLGANYSGLSWKFIVPLKAYYVALAFAVVFGLGFGIYPARKAAKLDPIEALRQE
ncbi:ABC transporter permease [Candidatus Falkowbacteria bacterium]|nr:ABC transporter permease [Candidatus Falkowbacteria bacterium]